MFVGAHTHHTMPHYAYVSTHPQKLLLQQQQQQQQQQQHRRRFIAEDTIGRTKSFFVCVLYLYSYLLRRPIRFYFPRHDCVLSRYTTTALSSTTRVVCSTPRCWVPFSLFNILKTSVQLYWFYPIVCYTRRYHCENEIVLVRAPKFTIGNRSGGTVYGCCTQPQSRPLRTQTNL